MLPATHARPRASRSSCCDSSPAAATSRCRSMVAAALARRWPGGSAQGARHHDGETAPPARRRCGGIGQRPAHPSQRAICVERCPDVARLPRRRRSRCARQRRDRECVESALALYRGPCHAGLRQPWPWRRASTSFAAPALLLRAIRSPVSSSSQRREWALPPPLPIRCSRPCSSRPRPSDQVTSARCRSKRPARRSAK